jgi:HPt (histidine-containing phosphotransfer) domain-containing protein
MSQVTAAIHKGEADLCDKLFQQVHRLAGSAGSYGFEALGQAASAVDRYLIAHAPESTDFPELESLLQILVEEIDKIVLQNAG